MTTLEDELRTALHAQAKALRVPERPALVRDIVAPGRRPGARWLMAAACLALIAVAVAALALLPGSDPEPAPMVDSVVPDGTDPSAPVTTVVPDTTDPTASVATVVPDVMAPTPAANGLVAVDGVDTRTTLGGLPDIYLIRPGGVARRLEIPGSEADDDACPAWSPDGARLLFGRLTAPADNPAMVATDLVIVPIGPDGAAGDQKVIALDGFEVLDGFQGHPCGIWAPDGRWVALAGTGEVWVVDTETSEIRRLPDLRPSDLEWRPGTDQLAIAGDVGPNRSAPTLSTPITVYTLSTGELGQLGSVEAAHFTWSPDGTTLAYEGGEDGPGELRLVDADGANDRLLVAGRGEVNHGIGPVWSPVGDRIAYQRICCAGAETHEVVLVNVADGSETIIDPPQTDRPDGPDNGPMQWYPSIVTWSPDGTTLLYTAWNEGGGGGTIAVRADSPTDVTVLSTAVGTGDDYSHRWVPPQRWGRRHPASTGATTIAKGDDVVIMGFGSSGLDRQTLSVDAEQQDGVVTGELRIGNVVVAIECAGAAFGGSDLILGGVVTENSEGLGVLDGTTVAVGDLLALIIRHDSLPGYDFEDNLDPLAPGRTQRVTLYQPGLWYGEGASEHTGSCTEVVESVPYAFDGGFFDDVVGDNDIETR